MTKYCFLRRKMTFDFVEKFVKLKKKNGGTRVTKVHGCRTQVFHLID